jgi:peptidoglycan/LPS O-acetylase OafA/YrhL
VGLLLVVHNPTVAPAIPASTMLISGAAVLRAKIASAKQPCAALEQANSQALSAAALPVVIVVIGAGLRSVEASAWTWPAKLASVIASPQFSRRDRAIAIASGVRDPSAMKKWQSIEGLRAWLAWTVVFGHCAQGTTNVEFISRIYWLAPPAVFVFIVISGFVITHLIIEKREPYGVFIVRRFMRLYPLFAASCVVGAITLPLLAHGLARLPWTSEAASIYGAIIASQTEKFWANATAHALLLHGAIPDQIIPMSSLTFSPPAWSLSLEWQFYLLAPLVVSLAASAGPKTVGALCLCWLGAFLFYHGKFGSFPVPSFLPGAAPAFAVGIASRLLWARCERKIARPTFLAAGLMALAPFAGYFMVPILVWLSFFGFLCADRSRADGPDAIALRIKDLAFEHRVALYWGERSYSVYLCHLPVLSLAVYEFAGTGSRPWPFLGAVTLCTICGTAALSIITYRFIERPGMALGQLLAGFASRRAEVFDGRL